MAAKTTSNDEQPRDEEGRFTSAGEQTDGQDQPRDEHGRFVSTDEADEGASADTHAVRLLESQHREVEALFAAYKEANDEDEQQGLFDRIADALAAHARIEETIFYPECMTDATSDELREAVEEHLEVKRTIAALMELEPSDEDWDSRMASLEKQVSHHVKEEEHELFEEVVESFDDELLIDMGRRMKAMFDDLIDREPRNAVPSETDQPAPLP